MLGAIAGKAAQIIEQQNVKLTKVLINEQGTILGAMVVCAGRFIRELILGGEGPALGSGAFATVACLILNARGALKVGSKTGLDGGFRGELLSLFSLMCISVFDDTVAL